MEACENALSALGMDAPQTFAVYARALRAAGNHERADYAYRQSLMRAPADGRVAIGIRQLSLDADRRHRRGRRVARRRLPRGRAADAPAARQGDALRSRGRSERAAALLEAASEQHAGRHRCASWPPSSIALRLSRLDDGASAIQRLRRGGRAALAQRHPVLRDRRPGGRPARRGAGQAAGRAEGPSRRPVAAGAGRRSPPAPWAIRSTASSATTTRWSAPTTSRPRRAGRAWRRS